MTHVFISFSLSPRTSLYVFVVQILENDISISTDGWILFVTFFLPFFNYFIAIELFVSQVLNEKLIKDSFQNNEFQLVLLLYKNLTLCVIVKNTHTKCRYKAITNSIFRSRKEKKILLLSKQSSSCCCWRFSLRFC